MSTELLNMAALKEAVIEAANKGGWQNEFQQGWRAVIYDGPDACIQDEHDSTIMYADNSRNTDFIAAAQIMNIDLNQFKIPKKDLLRKWCEAMEGKELGDSGWFVKSDGPSSWLIKHKDGHCNYPSSHRIYMPSITQAGVDLCYELYVKNYPIKEGE